MYGHEGKVLKTARSERERDGRETSLYYYYEGLSVGAFLICIFNCTCASRLLSTSSTYRVHLTKEGRGQVEFITCITEPVWAEQVIEGALA